MTLVASCGKWGWLRPQGRCAILGGGRGGTLGTKAGMHESVSKGQKHLVSIYPQERLPKSDKMNLEDQQDQTRSDWP